MAVLWRSLLGRVLRWNGTTCSALARFQLLPTNVLCAFGFPGGSACVRSRIPWALSTDSPMRQSFSCCSNPQIFTARGFEALISHTGTLGCMVCLTPQLFLPAYPHTNVGPPALPATTLSCVHSDQASHLHSSYQSR